MIRFIALSSSLFISNSYADLSGFFVGAGIGYATQQQSIQGSTNINPSIGVRLQFGYQLADWLGAEVGYNYITQGSNWNNLGAPSTTIYDVAITPGFTIPATPITVFVRGGVSAISANLNSNLFNQSFSSKVDFEYGAGAKLNLPFLNTFIRAQYINYGATPNNGNNNLLTTASIVLVDAAYVF